MNIMTVNADLSSLQIKVFKILAKDNIQTVATIYADNLAKGTTNITTEILDSKTGKKVVLNKSLEISAKSNAYLEIIKHIALDSDSMLHNVNYVVHKILHGGTEFSEIVLLHPDTIHRIESLSTFAPLHQPTSVLLARFLLDFFPKLKHYACFDTAFHTTKPLLNQIYGLETKYYEDGIRNYGFHGLSYQYIVHKLENYVDKSKLKGRYLIAHLGRASSICAIHKLRSVATTSGFCALGGVSIGAGDIDSAIPVYMQGKYNLSKKEVQEILYEKPGLLGICDISSRLDKLINSNEASADLVINYYVQEVAANIAKLSVYLGGVDGIIFTSEVGESSSYIRAKICDKLEFLGIDIKNKDNQENKGIISKKTSKIRVMVIPTNEEFAMAKQLLKRVQ